MTQAVILAGGKGTRLAALLDGKPKCLVDVDGVPLLQRQIELLISCGIDDVLLLVNHGADQVTRFLEERDHFGIQITIIDDGEPRGTSGAVLAAFDALAERFFVIYGDLLANVDLQRMLDRHVESHAEVTLFLHPNDHPIDSDLVEMDDDGWVREFHPYPHDSSRFYANLVNGALYVLEKKALEPWRDQAVPSDFGKHLFPAMLHAGGRIKGYVSFEYLKDVGTPSRLAKGVKHLRTGLVSRASLAQKQKAVFLDRDGTLNLHRGFIRSPDSFELIPRASEAVGRLNEAEYRVVLVTNQPVLARGEATFEDMRAIHAKMETVLGESGAFLDAIYLCPHHPDRGFDGEVMALKIECDCRKPKPGMVTRAMAELNIDPARSWMIGDTTLDIEAAKRAGVKSILVRTGLAGTDGRYSTSPDFNADDLAGAVDIILSY